MNFNASRNVGQPGGLRKAKRVSDVNAMGAPSPAPAFSPGAPYSAGLPAAGPPPPYTEGIQLDAQGFDAPSPGGNFSYGGPMGGQMGGPMGGQMGGPMGGQMGGPMGGQIGGPMGGPMGGFPQSPIASAAQLGSMIQQPIVQDMALQYGNQLAAQGKEVMQRELNKYVPVSRLRYYFAVDTRYVLKKLMLIVFPYTHKEWMVKYDQDTPVQPRYDLNAPDLYIPAMGYVTYVLLAGFMLGLQHRFSPEQIGMQASSALAYIIFEMILYLATLYITNTTTNLKTLDLLAFSGYKYTTMIGSLLVGLLTGRTGYYCMLVYTSVALSYFLVKTLRLQLLSGSQSTEQPTYGYGQTYGAPNPYTDHYKRSGGAKRKVYFLLFVAITQPLLSWWLTYHLVPSSLDIATPILPTR